MINTDFAEKFIEHISGYTDYNVNIMNEEGFIIASRDQSRVGQFHEVAWRIVKSGPDIVDTTEMKNRGNVRPGINMVIELDGEREGVVGVTGDPAEIRPIALMTKMAVETMLRYEKQQESARLRENKKERFIYILTHEEGADPTVLRDLALELGYPEEMIRIPILIQVPKSDTRELLIRLRALPQHTRKDFSIAPDDTHILVFKTLSLPTERLYTDYKYVLGEYLNPILIWLARNGRTIRLFVGSFQDSYSDYYYAYKHCKWLESSIKSDSTGIYFYDHVGEYLHSLVPRGEEERIYWFALEQLPGKRGNLLKTIEALIKSNYNFGQAAKVLFVHKNTLVYRYNKLKELLKIDPLNNNRDRAFLEGFYFYLRQLDLSEE